MRHSSAATGVACIVVAQSAARQAEQKYSQSIGALPVRHHVHRRDPCQANQFLPVICRSVLTSIRSRLKWPRKDRHNTCWSNGFLQHLDPSRERLLLWETYFLIHDKQKTEHFSEIALTRSFPLICHICRTHVASIASLAKRVCLQVAVRRPGVEIFSGPLDLASRIP